MVRTFKLFNFIFDKKIETYFVFYTSPTKMGLYTFQYSDVLDELTEVIDDWNDVNASFMSTIPFRYEALKFNLHKWNYKKFLYFTNEQIRIDYSNLLRNYYNVNNIETVVPLLETNKTKWWNDIVVNRSREYMGTIDVLVPDIKWLIISFI